MFGRSLLLAAIALVSSLLPAQMSTLPAARAIADLFGPPKNPPIFSEMTMILQGGLQYQDTANFRGPVAAVEREENQSTSQNPEPYHTKTMLKFDGDGHLIQRTDEGALGTSITTNIWEHGRLQSQTVAHHRNDGRLADWNEWQRWSYDTNGRLMEFKAGRDKEEMNDYVNFRYDSKGRPLGYELYAQTLTEISYEGNKITLSRLQKYQGRKFFEQVQVVDDKNRVIDLKVSDLSAGQLKLWYHVTFKYDDKGRVIEQNTDPFKLGDGDDYSPLPSSIATVSPPRYEFLMHPVRSEPQETCSLILRRIKPPRILEAWSGK
ncbi:MAG TPA: hypothetical protein VKA07_14905 [Candidatus Sulfotelmatobacter sp.]|nr:hypothetical protein [Candidatus Sulfotelmatobacter sp.]